MRNALFIAWNDLRRNLVRREAIVWVFVMPIVFFYFIGTVSGGFGPKPERAVKLSLLVGEDPGFLLDRLEQRLTERDFEVVRAADEATFRATKLRLKVPAHFTRDVLAAQPVALVLGSDGDDLDGEFRSFQVQRAVYTLLADVIASQELEGSIAPDRFAALDAMPRTLSIDVQMAGERKRIPQGFEQAVPGTLTMFTLMVMLTSAAIGLLIERREGLLRRLAFAPMRRGEIVAGKWLANLGMGVVQVAWGMVVGALLFGIRWGDSWAMIGLVMLGWASLAASLGLLSGSLARSEGQAVGIGVLTSNVLAALGGCWWPIEVAPKALQELAKFLPTGWTMDALHKLVSFGLPASTVWPQVALLFGCAWVCLALAARRFRFA